MYFSRCNIKYELPSVLHEEAMDHHCDWEGPQRWFEVSLPSSKKWLPCFVCCFFFVFVCLSTCVCLFILITSEFVVLFLPKSLLSIHHLLLVNLTSFLYFFFFNLSSSFVFFFYVSYKTRFCLKGDKLLY